MALAELEVQRERTAWEIEEIVSVGLFVCIALLAASGIAGALAGSVNEGEFLQQAWQRSLIQATEWAGLLTGFLLLVIFGLIWRQVDGWGDLLTAIDGAEEIDESVDRQHADDAVGHLSRNRSFATLLVVFCIVTSISSVACTIGQVSLYGSGPAGEMISQALISGGESLATVILCGIALVGAIHLRRRSDYLLAVDPEPD